jgi:excinuclease UvrABC helicase subunit UvrB
MRYTQKSVNRNHTCKPKVVEREIEEKVELERERERERERDREREREEWGDTGWPSAFCTAYQASDCDLGQ